MSTKPISFRYISDAELADQTEGVKNAHRLHEQGIVDLNGAVQVLAKQLAAFSPSGTAGTSSTIVENITQNIIQNSIFGVNDQTGQTAYTTSQSDYGAFVILNDALPIAVTLSVATGSPSIQAPWGAFFLNFGVGTATLTPVSGLVNGSASLSMASGTAVIVAFTGENFWAILATV